MEEELASLQKMMRVKKWGVRKKARIRKYNERDSMLDKVMYKWSYGKELLHQSGVTNCKMMQYVNELRKAYKPSREFSFE
jgi:hypothetical protein